MKKIICLIFVLLLIVSCTPDSITDVTNNDIVINTWSEFGDTVYVSESDTSSIYPIYSDIIENEKIIEDSTVIKFYSSKGQITTNCYTLNGQVQTEFKPYNSQGEVVYGSVLIQAALTKSQIIYDSLSLNIVKNYGNDNIIVTSLYPQVADTIKIMGIDNIDFNATAIASDDLAIAYHWFLDDIAIRSNIGSYTFNGNSDTNEGIHNLSLQIVDNAGSVVEFKWVINVIYVALPITVIDLIPVISGSEIVIDEGGNVDFNCNAIDPDDGVISYIWKLNDIEISTTNEYDFVTDYADNGDHIVNLTIASTDSARNRYKSIDYSWNIKVNDVDGDLIVKSLTPPTDKVYTLLENDTLLFSVWAYDLDEVDLNYKWELNGDSVSLDTLYTFTTDSSSLESNTLKLFMNDSSSAKSSVSYEWTILVDKNSLVVDSLSFTENQLLILDSDEEQSVSVFAHDLEGNNVQYLWKLNDQIISNSSSVVINSNSLQTGLSLGDYDLQVEVWSKEVYVSLKYSCQIKIKEDIPKEEAEKLE